jgi:hypothetical protein
MLEALSQRLSGEYGGPMEHLWINLELSPGEADHRPAWGFRFQKRVAPPRELAAFKLPDSFNVGHYSVRPDYFALAQVDMESIPAYIAGLLYDSTRILMGKRRRLGDFDVELFRARFAQALHELGLTTAPRADE